MSQAPNLLNEDGSASMATMLMMSHHAFRLGLARLAKALEIVARGERARVPALRDEWTWFHQALHGHHQSEDHGVFPSLAEEHASVRATVEKLGADHRLIDPLLEQGDKAFAELPNATPALAVVRQLRELLAPHLALENAPGAPPNPAPPAPRSPTKPDRQRARRAEFAREARLVEPRHVPIDPARLVERVAPVRSKHVGVR